MEFEFLSRTYTLKPGLGRFRKCDKDLEDACTYIPSAASKPRTGRTPDTRILFFETLIFFHQFGLRFGNNLENDLGTQL